MTTRIIIDEFDRQLRKARIHGVPERRDLRRRRARLMVQVSASTMPEIPRLAEDVQRAVAGPHYTLGEIFQLALIRLPARV
ncbi:hypothetical protein ABID82_001606 [Methylobacterium sp. PvP062]|jgi:hypothetical protein|uniref:Uncharacterized protein n=2 Tax=Methylobacterium TaxID=407 RepID=A0A509E9R2_9HYPH|nr:MULTISPECIES: hypothetical protein [Methylobacterium]MCX7333368.1 hypothetical protein [Hyphomicrobiales bacterium]MCY4508563.1 hypothetical protein [Acidobacteriota bacterium]GAN46096.1 septation ring formation regulator EzrA [Methylobacterium sp. ME121]MBN6818394.1 hypothetical protein [Methylobacterium organophilum]MBP2492810.1 hypothetical protein [Methylobacterium sp. PvP105]